jgi:hypothetical protein
MRYMFQILQELSISKSIPKCHQQMYYNAIGYTVTEIGTLIYYGRYVLSLHT